jgi:DNA-binding NarL/FixJ family response regulator
MQTTCAGLRLVVVGRHRLTRHGLCLTLEAEPDLTVAAEASDADGAVAAVAGRYPDVVVIDALHPCGPERALVRAVHRVNCALPVLIVADRLCSCSHRVFAAGVKGVLLKDSGPEQLASAIKNVSVGYAVVPATLTCRLSEPAAVGRSPGPRPPDHAAKLARLTARESDVLRCLVTGASNAEAADRLHLSEGTVKAHVQHLLAKLDVRDRVQAIIYAYESGFVAAGGASAPGPEDGVPQAARPAS